MSLGEAAHQPISTLPKGVIDVAALPDISRLGAHVVRDIVVKVAFIPKRAFFVLLQGWKSYCYWPVYLDFENYLLGTYT